MKRSIRLRTQMSILMALLVLLQSLGLVFALSISNVLYLLDAESFRLFDNTTETRMQTFDSAAGQLISNATKETDNLANDIDQIAQNAGVSSRDIYANDEVYDAVSSTSAQYIISFLQSNNISGAFVMLNGSNSDKDNPQAHSALYIRNSAPNTIGADTSNYLLEIGPISVAQNYQVTSSINWDLDIQLNDDEKASRYYTAPLWAAEEYPRSETERYGYWSPPNALLNDNQQVITYTLPLVDSDGEGYGVFGIEISMAHFTSQYLPNVDLPYQNSFYAIAPTMQEELQLDWIIPSGPLAQVYLKQGDHLSFTPISGATNEDISQVTLAGLGDMYCATHPLNMYSSNSPFIADGWSLVGFVPQDIMHETSTNVKNMLIISIVGTTFLAIAAIFVLSFVSTRKITSLSAHVESLSPTQEITFRRTGLKEVDELTSAVSMLNNSVINASKTTSKILELTLLPIGVYEIYNDSDYVTLTDYICELVHIDPNSSLRKEEWPPYRNQLTAKKAEEFENVYEYKKNKTDAVLWLRILEQETDNGLIGVVLDVTKDIEESMRLARELDYDSLTYLYSRTAFKREAFKKINDQPNKIGALVFSDLDNLKYINDTFGHDIGDRMIIRAAELFREFNGHDGITSRISGDEFAVYIHGYSSKKEARAIIEKQMERFAYYTLTTPDGHEHKIRCSTGIAWYPSDSDNITDLLKLADYAMYEAKHKEKGALYEFNKRSYLQNSYLLKNREAINRLLEDSLIRFAFQPIVDLKTGEIYAYEALMRSLLDDFKSPMEILAVAAAQSKLGQLERLVIITAFESIQENLRLLGDARVFINSIPSQILSDEDQLMLERNYQHLFDKVVVEITEAENDSTDILQRKIAFYKKVGIQLAIDDFGSGYSNEVRILSISPDIIKIDMELIQGIHENEDKQKLVLNLVLFFHSKNIRIVAEGVEDIEDLETIIAMGVDYVQGYYVSRPNFEICDIEPSVKRELGDIIRKYSGSGFSF